jgi:carbonic anhydrase
MGRKDINNDHSIVEKDASKASSYLKSLLEGNQKWVDSKKSEDPEFFTKLAKPQTPKYLYFGCSDSRVPANQILGKG